MTKDWKKEVKKLLSEQYGGKTALNDMFGQQIEEFIEEDSKDWLKLLDKHLSKAVAKEKTQLLARVREEVIEEIDFPILLLETTTKLPAMAVDVKGILEQLKQEQLKKLEIISEEVK